MTGQSVLNIRNEVYNVNEQTAVVMVVIFKNTE